MPSTLQDRVKELESKLEALSREFAAFKAHAQVKEFIRPSEAAKMLEISPTTICARIHQAKAFPKESLYKEGIHWKQTIIPPKTPGGSPTVRYLVNPVEWRKVG